MNVLTVLLLVTATAWVAITVRQWLTWGAILPLPPGDGDSGPGATLSIVIPFRNEMEFLEDTVHRLLRYRGDSMEVILVDDASEDGSGEAADRLAEADPRVLVHHISSVPTGWLGKAHACWHGAALSRGAYILFMDADVKTGTSLLPAVLRYLSAERPAHLVLLPRMLTEGYAERMLMALFLLVFSLRFDPAAAMRRGSKQYFGIGAFNLLRRDVYEAFGGYSALAAEVADDVMIGKLVKLQGQASTVFDGTALCAVRWRRGFLDTLKGIKRSVFPGLGYRWRWVAAAAAAITIGMMLPYAALFAPDAGVRIAAAMVVLLIQFAFVTLARGTGSSPSAGLILPLTSGALLCAILLSAMSTLLHGGVEWRGRTYRTKDLRERSPGR